MLPTKSSASKTKEVPKDSAPKSPTDNKPKGKTKSAPKPPSPKLSPVPKSPAPAPPRHITDKVLSVQEDRSQQKGKAPLSPSDHKPPDTNKKELLRQNSEGKCSSKPKESVIKTKGSNSCSEKQTSLNSVGAQNTARSSVESKPLETTSKIFGPRRKLFKTKPDEVEDDDLEEQNAGSRIKRVNSIEDEKVAKLDLPENKCIIDLFQSKMATGADPESGDQPQVPQLEYIYVTNNKLKYMNKDFQKVNAKMYDYKCDIKLKVADQNYKAHKEVLSNASDYFNAMFSCNMKEKDQDVIELKEISPKGFSAMMDYFYHGHVTIDPDNIEDVIEAARFFHNDWLLECCCDFLIRHLSLENYSSVITLADKYWLGDLRWDIFRFIGENLGNLIQQENFYQNLSMELLLQFLMENIYVEAAERFVLEIILNWVRAKPEERKEHMLSLLRQVRFPLMEIEELETLPEEVLETTEIKDAVEDALNYNLNLMGQCMKRGEMYLQRGARTVIAIMSFTEEGNMVVYRDPEKPGFFVEQLGPVGLDTVDYQALGQTKLGNYLYAAGGYDGTYSSTNRVFRFDPRYRDWTEVACMNQARVSFAMCSSDTQLFVAGGVNRVEEDETILDTVEVYTPEDNSWSPLQSVPIKCCDAALAYHNNCLYYTGGISIDPADPIPLDNTWCLDLSDGSGWVPKQSMMTGRQGHSLISHGNKLYAIGGLTSVDGLMTFKNCLTNEVYDFETNQWTEIAPTPEHYGQLFRNNGIIGNKIFFIGSTGVVANLFVYDIESDTWEECESIGPNMQKLAILDVAYPYT